MRKPTAKANRQLDLAARARRLRAMADKKHPSRAQVAAALELLRPAAPVPDPFSRIRAKLDAEREGKHGAGS